MAGGLRYETGRDMPPGMQIAAAKEFLCREAGTMLAVLQQVDENCEFCVNAGHEYPCSDVTPEDWCPNCKATDCPCHGCVENSKYQWCGAEEAMRRLAMMKQK